MRFFAQTKRFYIAHWILTQIFKEQPEMIGRHILVDNNGVLFYERDGIMNEAAESKTRIGYLEKQTTKYSKGEITQAVNLLVSNKHVKLEFIQNSPYDNVFITSTAEGAIAYVNEFYIKEADERLEKWPKRNWHLFAFITFVIGLISPILIDKLKSVNLTHTKEESTQSILKQKDSVSIK
jgi:hypothetical protein